MEQENTKVESKSEVKRLFFVVLGLSLSVITLLGVIPLV